MDLTSTLQHGAPGRMPPGWGEKVVNPLVVLTTMILIIKTTKMQVLKMLLLRLLAVRRLLLRMHPRGNKRLGYPLLLHPEDEEGQQLFLPQLLLPIIDAVLRHTTPLFRGPGIDSVKILLRILLATELGM
jgi:hypothetical protein